MGRIDTAGHLDNKGRKDTSIRANIVAPASFPAATPPESRDQMEAGVRAAEILQQFVGRLGDPVRVTISASANAGHVPSSTQQFITVTVTNDG